MESLTADAVVVGAGPNGLVAANALADAGWDVVVVEANPEVGGAVRSGHVTAPGYVTDLFSAFYPLAAASPVISDLDLGRHGLTWVTAPAVLAHALDDGRAVVLHDDPEQTAASVEEFAAGDGQAWLDMVHRWRRIRDPLLDALFTPFPPLAPGMRLARRLGLQDGLDMARLAVTPVRRLAAEHFRGEGAALLLAGNAMHSDLTPDAGGSGLFGWLLAMLGQDVGFPVPRGGAGRFAVALQDRATERGTQFLLDSRVVSIEVAGGRATGVRTAGGTRITARRAVLADVAAPALFGDLVGSRHLPARLRDRLHTFEWDNATLKVNWALGGRIAWRNPAVSGAGTVHLGVDNDGLVDFAADISTGRMPRRPFVLFGQMTTADPTRSPLGTESAWAYTHLPRRLAYDDLRLAEQVARVEASVERCAPGFLGLVRARSVQTPAALEQADANLVAGAINAGTSGLHQQLVFRPFTGLGRPETPLEGLYLASASAHPGGGVHGACGWNAARAALAWDRPRSSVRRAMIRTAWARLLRD